MESPDAAASRKNSLTFRQQTYPPFLLPFPKKRPGFLEENRGIHNHMERKRENQPIQSRTTLPDFPEFMASNPSRNSV